MKKCLIKHVEIYRTKNPNWKAAIAVIKKTKKDNIVELLEVLQDIKLAWKEKHPFIKRIPCKYTIMLLAVNSSSDANYNAIINLAVFIKSGMAAAAGFYLPE